MLWVLGYWIVGLVGMSIMLQPVLRRIAEECKDDSARIGIASLVIIILICVLTPLWPAFLTVKVIKLCSKWSGTSAK
ncbi:hypothetical protein [Bacillus thuringiensis]|uniref:hypothetical protein n=1 Tax=Bacillus thuringiensis TaxID=1428 RepID=UPI000BFB67C9|nr:hypothetical protein [Bacillus thuringiensis]EKS8367468.1 hypothetical protein [Bacillus cereus]PGL15708.1 hypothetical protein CN916_31265 [Bacillus thuringiensis]